MLLFTGWHEMIAAGEDMEFVARRIMICAAEDVGMADPQALLVATSAFQALRAIGLPEARIPLAEAAIYVALAPKSNAVINAIDAALADVNKIDVGKCLTICEMLIIVVSSRG